MSLKVRRATRTIPQVEMAKQGGLIGLDKEVILLSRSIFLTLKDD